MAKANFTLNHVAISVPNLDDAIQWYTEVFDLSILMPAITLERSQMPDLAMFKVYPPSCMKLRTALLSTGEVEAAGLELFQFEDPSMQPGMEANFERDYPRGGFFHMALTVDDVDGVVDKVVSHGGRKIGPTMPIPHDHKACYVADRWGNVIELVSESFDVIMAKAKERAQH